MFLRQTIYKIYGKNVKKIKNYEDLGPKQKRRRLDIIRCQQHISEDSDSSADERVINDPPLIDLRPELRNEVQNVPAEPSSSDSFDDSANDSAHDDSSISSEDEARDDNVSMESFEFPNENESDTSADEEILAPENAADASKRILKNAFLAAGLKHNQGNILLKTLRSIPFGLAHLPKDSRTLLNTPSNVASRQIQQIAGGEYLHIGLKETFRKKLEALPENYQFPEILIIELSTDGAKINKGFCQYWPIQYRICNITDKRPIIVGIFKGIHKPSCPFDFFQPFVQEVLEIQGEGVINVRNRQIPLHVRRFIADAPARAFSLNHYGHMSTNPCLKCKVEGDHCTEVGFERTMVFLGVDHPLRNDEDYANVLDEDHQKGRTPLADIIRLVTDVPFERMHLVYLGAVKKILSAKIDGQFGHRSLQARLLNILDSRMIQLKMYCPSEFNRRPNEISAFKNFKATEYRQFLLYTSPAVLQNVFSDEYYTHFMMLNCNIHLLVSEETP
ncbi:uncharacterized protein LOC127289463 isoform X2 [Leptopilina boulardi]|uniref:uncharacterized protein LOC127289463 isoform X2 n=1 Tax=Leptopilina boulardi TaxID=63433 RepID=UPI0021F5C02C|nr:uncharacterized protein LOC127289463 isoform X2 [Leptopilina boulardi]